MKRLIILILSILINITHLFAVYHTDWIESFESDIIELKVQNDLIYVITANEGLSIYSLEPNELPVFILNYPEILTNNLIIDGNFAFQTSSQTISKYNISDPENLIFLGSFDIPNNIVDNPVNQVYIKNDLLCIASFDDEYGYEETDTFIDLFNIQDINNVQHLICFEHYGFELGVRAKIFYFNNENYLYLTPGELGTRIYDCNDLLNIQMVGVLDMVQRPIMINENYIVTFFSEIFQFNTYSTVTLIDDLNFCSTAAWQIDDIILLNCSNNVSYLYDLSENSIINHYYAFNQIPVFNGDFLFLAKNHILQRIDVRYPINYDELYHLDYNVNGFTIDNNKIIFEINSGLGIVNLENSQFPFYEIQTSYNDGFFINDDLLITYDYHYSYTNFELFNIEELNNPILLNSFELSDTGRPYILIDNSLYCFDLNTIKVISIESPLNPQIVNELNFENDYYQAEFVKINSILYLFGSGKSASIDISDSLNPTILVEYSLPSNPQTLSKVIMIDNIAYILPDDGDTILHIYDYNNPELPVFINTIDLLRSIDKIFKIDDKIAICTNDINTIYFYDIDNYIPYLSAEYGWNNKTYDLQKYNDHLLASSGYFGISALSMSITPVDEMVITQNNNIQIYNFPNPFNPTTTIEFSIQIDSKIELTIYNIKGQKVKMLSNKNFIEGNHSILWNGKDDSDKFVSSGIYFYKLNVNGKTEAVTKCLLLK